MANNTETRRQRFADAAEARAKELTAQAAALKAGDNNFSADIIRDEAIFVQGLAAGLRAEMDTNMIALTSPNGDPLVIAIEGFAENGPTYQQSIDRFVRARTLNPSQLGWVGNNRTGYAPDYDYPEED